MRNVIFMARITKDLEAMLEPKPAPWLWLAPPLALSVLLIFSGAEYPRWVMMWLFALLFWAACKWATWRHEGRWISTTTGRKWAYLLAWPGMDAREFLEEARIEPPPRIGEWLFALAKTCAGAALVWGVARMISPGDELMVGWVGLIGLAFLFHFGLFHLLALFWQRAGLNAQPIMRAPVLSKSVAEFWNRRWNVAFNQLVYPAVFRPLARRLNPLWACLAAFLVSGLVHELVISIPAGGGYGLPTAYFLVQGCAVLLERSRVGRLLGLRHGWRGWLFTVLVTAGPVFGLFHPPFIRNVILPMLSAIGATGASI
jgi:hypothetical protein